MQALADDVQEALRTYAANDAIKLCGQASLHIIATHPEKVMDLAHGKLHAFPYQDVPEQWRRLFEDASLHKVVELLRAHSKDTDLEPDAKRRKTEHIVVASNRNHDWLQEVVNVLDRGLSLSGAPGRPAIFEHVFEQLHQLTVDETEAEERKSFNLEKPKVLVSEYPIDRTNEPLDLEGFQTRLDTDCTPLIITGAIEEWPARRSWINPSHLDRHTLGGRRLVPVEVGESYVADGWSQRMMPMREFVATYLISKSPLETGYLAQYDLFAQIPALRDGISIPDYCYSTPPPADADALKTAGLASVQQLDEPLLNAWLGPKGTKTPLHTDPYHNILCQVVGYKYVRLYPPKETCRLYPRGVDEKGISMHNTSQVDMSRLWKDARAEDVERMSQNFPLFREAEYVEGIIGPGDSLYVPLGWWHYVESLSTSFSTSFWWN
ncbi:hypothetical protein LTR17_011340 [Elasticomyces elasticus]|nr:hypothetical protein LTR17_011340 [Elasticomyces elasticus]